MDNISDFILVSGIIEEDSNNGFLTIPIDSTHNLACSNFSISRKNNFFDCATIDHSSVNYMEKTGQLNISAIGTIDLKTNPELITTLKQFSCSKAPITLSINNVEINNMYVSSFKLSVDKIGVKSICTIIFSEGLGIVYE